MSVDKAFSVNWEHTQQAFSSNVKPEIPSSRSTKLVARGEVALTANKSISNVTKSKLTLISELVGNISLKPTI